jgi:hypothetical protein
LKPDQSSGLATAPELALLDLIRRKALGESIPEMNEQSFPTSDLMAMTLGQIVETVDALAHCQGAKNESDKRHAVLLASGLLMDWPRRFLEFLDPQTGTERALTFRRNLIRMHHVLCGPDHARKAHMDFLGAVMVEYAWRRWDYRHSQIGRYQNQIPTGLLDHMADRQRPAGAISVEVNSVGTRTKSAAEAARFLCCSPTAIQGLVRSGMLSGSVNAAMWRVDNASLERFRREYFFLVELAATEHTPVKYLMKLCSWTHIQVFLPRATKTTGIQPYIRTAEVERLKSALSMRRARRARR